MKSSELTPAIVRSAILPSSAMKDQEATLKWLALPDSLRGRCRAAERLAVLINPAMGRTVREDVPPAGATGVVATIEVHSDGSTTVRPSSFPPAIVPEPEVRPTLLSNLTPTPTDETAQALKAIRKLFLDWKGGPYVCGNAFKRMHEVEAIISKLGY